MPYLTRRPPRPALAYLDAVTGRLVWAEPPRVDPTAIPAPSPTTTDPNDEETEC